MNTTTKRFPRSLNEAFADERASAIEHYRSPSRSFAGIADVVAAVVFGIIGGCLLVHWLAS